MSALVLQDFLVSLGFQIDANSHKKFARAIAVQTEALHELGIGIKTVAADVTGFLRGIAEDMEKLYFSSQRTKASTDNILALGFAAGQMGSSAEAASASLENLARFMRNNPGGEGLMRSIGVQTRQANGELRDTEEVLQDLGKRFAQMPYYRAHSYAEMLGIDEKTLMALREGMGEFGKQYKDMLAAAGLDTAKAAKASHEWMNQLRTLGATIQILAMKVAQQALPALERFTEKLRAAMLSHMPFISDVLSKAIDFIGNLIGRLIQFGDDAVDAWMNLSTSSKILIATLAAIGVAWEILNSEFLLSPIGIIMALGAAIFLLWEDYKGWKEGADSLIDWSVWEGPIKNALAAIDNLVSALGDLFVATMKMMHLPVFTFDFKTDLPDVLNQVTDITNGLAAVARGDWHTAGILLKRGLQSKEWRDANPVDSMGRSTNGKPTDPGDNSYQGYDPVLNPDATLRQKQGRSQYDPASTEFHPYDQILARDGSLRKHEKRGIRNNNPGLIEYGPFARKEGATGLEGNPYDGTAPRFAKFQGPQMGLDAMADLLKKNYFDKGLDTIASIVHKYAPKEDGNDEAAYAADLAKRMGIASTSAHLNLSADMIENLMNAMITHENGRNPYSKEMMATAATHAENDNSKAVTVTSQTDIHVAGGNDARGTAAAVAREQDAVNSRLVRNLVPASK